MMGRKFIAILYFFTIALVASFLVYKLIQSTRQLRTRANVGSLLPDFTLYDIDYRPYKLAFSDQPTVIIFFNSTCENCIHEAQIIRENISLFGDACIVMLSTETIPSIQQFSEQTGLLGYHNIKFARIEPGDQEEKLGPISFPLILIYGPDNRLVRKFQGTVDPKEILSYLHAR